MIITRPIKNFDAAGLTALFNDCAAQSQVKRSKIIIVGNGDTISVEARVLNIFERICAFFGLRKKTHQARYAFPVLIKIINENANLIKSHPRLLAKVVQVVSAYILPRKERVENLKDVKIHVSTEDLARKCQNLVKNGEKAKDLAKHRIQVLSDADRKERNDIEHHLQIARRAHDKEISEIVRPCKLDVSSDQQKVFNTLFEERNEWGNVLLVANDKQAFPCHDIVLQRIDYMGGMIRGLDRKENDSSIKNRKRLELLFDCSTIKLFIKCCYYQDISNELSFEQMFDLYYLGEYMGDDVVKDRIYKELLDRQGDFTVYAQKLELELHQVRGLIKKANISEAIAPLKKDYIMPSKHASLIKQEQMILNKYLVLRELSVKTNCINR